MLSFNNATITSIPTGTAVSGSTNIFVYPILSNVTLTCTTDPSPTASTIFTWNIVSGCTACFPLNGMAQSVNTSSLSPDDAGTFTCTADGGSGTTISDSFTLRVSCKLQQLRSHNHVTNWYVA